MGKEKILEVGKVYLGKIFNGLKDNHYLIQVNLSKQNKKIQS